MRQEAATDRTSCISLMGMAALTPSLQKHVRCRFWHGLYQLTHKLILLHSHKYILHQNAHLCIHTHPYSHTHTYMPAPIHIDRRLCHHFSFPVTLTLCCFPLSMHIFLITDRGVAETGPRLLPKPTPSWSSQNFWKWELQGFLEIIQSGGSDISSLATQSSHKETLTQWPHMEGMGRGHCTCQNRVGFQSPVDCVPPWVTLRSCQRAIRLQETPFI